MSITHVYKYDIKNARLRRYKRSDIRDYDTKFDVCAIVTDRAGNLPVVHGGERYYPGGKYAHNLKALPVRLYDRIYLSSGVRGLALYCSQDTFEQFIEIFDGEIVHINERPFRYILQEKQHV